MDIDQLDQAAAWFANRLFDGRIAATTFRLESDPNYLGVYKGWSSKTGHSIGFNDELYANSHGIISELYRMHEQCHAWRAVEGIPEGDGHGFTRRHGEHGPGLLLYLARRQWSIIPRTRGGHGFFGMTSSPWRPN